jgi:hypothetical protein
MDLKQAYIISKLRERQPRSDAAPAGPLPADASIVMMAAMLSSLNSIDSKLGGLPRQTPG